MYREFKMILEQIKLNKEATLALSHLVSEAGVKSNEDCVQTINMIINKSLSFYQEEASLSSPVQVEHLNSKVNKESIDFPF